MKRTVLFITSVTGLFCCSLAPAKDAKAQAAADKAPAAAKASLQEHIAKDKEKNHPAGIEDEAERKELIRLAQNFAKAADTAVAFETARKAASPAAR